MQVGSGASGVRVLSFVRVAPNDRFSPQSGPVQRGIINTAFGSESHNLATLVEKRSPFGACGTTFPPQAGALWALNSVPHMTMQGSIERFILPPE